MSTLFLTEAQIQERIREHTSDRYRRIDRLERYVDGEQYAGRPSWFDDRVPLFDRAPCIVAPTVENAISSHVGLIFKKCPVVSTAPDEDESKLDPEYGLAEAASAMLDAGIVQIIKHAKLLACWKQLLRDSMGMSSAAVAVATIQGRLTVDVLETKTCTPTWSTSEPGRLERVEIRYPFVKETQDPETGKWGKTVMLFRREIDAMRDVTYLPVNAPKLRTDPVQWQEDPSKIFEHKLGFCPVHWFRFMCTTKASHKIDGRAIHEKILDELTAFDFAASQKFRAAIYTADPITLEIGVKQGTIPTEPALVTGSFGPPLPGFPEDKGNEKWREASAPSRKRGPGRVWQYEDKDVKVQYLTLPAGALETLQREASSIYHIILDALSWAPVDPKEMASGATLSGRALELLYTKQVTYCDDVRSDFAEGMILPSLALIFRFIVAMQRQGVRLALPGYEKVAKILAGFETKNKDGSAQWVTPRMTVKWVDYFAPAETEQKTFTDMMVSLNKEGLLKPETVIAALAQVIPALAIENPKQYAEGLEADRKRKAEEQMAMMQKAAAAAQGGPQAAPVAQKPPAVPAAKPKAEPKTPAAPKPPRAAKPSPFKKRAPQPSPAMG